MVSVCACRAEQEHGMSKQEIRRCLTEVEVCEGVVVQVSSLWSGTERAAMVMCAGCERQ